MQSVEHRLQIRPLVEKLSGRSVLTLLYAAAAALALALIGTLVLLDIRPIPGRVPLLYAEFQPVIARRAFLAISSFLLVSLAALVFWTMRPDNQWQSRAARLSAVLVLVWAGATIAHVMLSLLSVRDGLGQSVQPSLQHLAVLSLAGAMVTGIPLLMDWHIRGSERSGRTASVLATLAVVMIAFSLSVAMLRGGYQAISSPYERTTMEPVGDIGKIRTPGQFLADFNRLHPDLSLHGKVYPPGPTLVLWFIAQVVGDAPLHLALATVIIGSLGVVPTFFWGRQIGGPRVGMLAASFYTLIPSFVIYGATSFNILQIPVLLLTLWLFSLSLDRSGPATIALSAGVCYAILSLLSFNLLVIGLWFALEGLRRITASGQWRSVFWTAVWMVTAFLLIHVLIRMAFGFDYITAFQSAKASFESDQTHLPLRHGFWAFRLWNPLTLLIYAGIPTSVLAFLALGRWNSSWQSLPAVMLATFLGIMMMYLARGEGERSAMHALVFLMIPAALMFNEISERSSISGTAAVTVGCLAAQSWLIESLLNTYW